MHLLRALAAFRGKTKPARASHRNRREDAYLPHRLGKGRLLAPSAISAREPATIGAKLGRRSSGSPATISAGPCFGVAISRIPIRGESPNGRPPLRLIVTDESRGHRGRFAVSRGSFASLQIATTEGREDGRGAEQVMFRGSLNAPPAPSPPNPLRRGTSARAPTSTQVRRISANFGRPKSAFKTKKNFDRLILRDATRSKWMRASSERAKYRPGNAAAHLGFPGRLRGGRSNPKIAVYYGAGPPGRFAPSKTRISLETRTAHGWNFGFHARIHLIPLQILRNIAKILQSAAKYP